MPVALADSAAYSAYALPGLLGAAAGPASLQSSASSSSSSGGDLSYLLQRHYQAAYQPHGLLNPYQLGARHFLPTIGPCFADWSRTTGATRAATISLDEIPPSTNNSPTPSSTNGPTATAMHGDRNPLALAASEAAAASTANSSSSNTNTNPSSASTSSSSTTPKVEAGSSAAAASLSLSHPILFSFPHAAANRNCDVTGNCSCTTGVQSSPTCPKNVLAGPPTGNFKNLIEIISFLNY